MKEQSVHLVELTQGDGPNCFTILNDKMVKRYCNHVYIENIHNIPKFLHKVTNKSECLSYKIVNQLNKVVGIIIGEITGETIGITYVIGKEYRNKGYAKKAIIALVEDVQNMNYYTELFFLVNKHNLYSRKVIEYLNPKQEELFFKGSLYILYSKKISR